MDFEFDYRPSDSQHVALVWRTHSRHGGSFISNASCGWEMVVTRYGGKTHVTLRGPESKASVAPVPAHAAFLGISFKLGSYMPRLPVSQLVDTEIHLPEQAGGTFRLHGRDWEFPSFENVDTFVARLERDGLLARDEAVVDALQGQRQYLSPRALQYRFVRATGLSQAAIAGIERARKAMSMLEQGASILHTALEAGYADQPHLTRALKRLAGKTPAQIARGQAA